MALNYRGARMVPRQDAVPSRQLETNTIRFEPPALVFQNYHIDHRHRHGIHLEEKEATIKFKLRDGLHIKDIMEKIHVAVWKNRANRRKRPSNSSKTWGLSSVISESLLFKDKPYHMLRLRHLRNSCPAIAYDEETRCISISFRICFDTSHFEGPPLPPRAIFRYEVGAYLVMKREMIQLVDSINQSSISTSEEFQEEDHTWEIMKEEMATILNIPQYAEAVEQYVLINKRKPLRQKNAIQENINCVAMLMNVGLSMFGLWYISQPQFCYY